MFARLALPGCFLAAAAAFVLAVQSANADTVYIRNPMAAASKVHVILKAADAKDAATQVDQMCARLLANPVIETYSFELEKAGKK
jgi:phosphoribosylformylglycinamidine synthase PurS subunit